ncbi:MAG: hypothetical protein ABSE73_26695, partial [Planctomycetota bacterium]
RLAPAHLLAEEAPGGSLRLVGESAVQVGDRVKWLPGQDGSPVLVRRLDPHSPRTEGKLVWELSNLGLKGGEVIAYYAYALDGDTISGPKMAKSDIHFLTIYDEQEYDNPQSPKKMPGTPEAVKQLDKLIEAQKKLLKDTFGQARQRETAAPQPVTDSEKAASRKTAEAQEKLRAQVQDLIDKVKTELANSPLQGEEKPVDGQGGPKPQKPGLGETELKHMEQATKKMEIATASLQIPEAPKAVRPETEALRHLSETRRLLLSDKEGDPRFKMAMDKQSKKRKQREQDQQQQDQEQAQQEMTQLPKMMEREKQLERELEELQERKKKNPPPPPDQRQTDEQKQEQEQQRRLEREKQQELERLAREAEERARKLDELAARNADMQSAAEKMAQAEQNLQKAAEEAKQRAEQNTREAKEKTHEAYNKTRDAHHELRNALEKQIRREIANLQKDAQELAQREQDLAQQAQQAAKEQQQGQDQQSQQSQPAPQGQPQQQDQTGQPQAQGQPQKGPGSEQKLKGMATEQRGIKEDLKELAQRLDKAAQTAAEKDLAGTPSLEQARQQAGEKSPAGQAAQKAQEAMQSAKAPEAQRESATAAKALEQLATTLREATQKTTAGDMKALAAAMKKLQGLAKEQSDVNRDLASKSAPSQLAQREEHVSAGAKELADNADKLEVLRQQGRHAAAKEKLNDAAKQAEKAAQNLSAQDTAAAKAPAEQSEKALNQALNEMERAAGKTLEEKAREAKSIARAARENQERATEAAKEIAPPDAQQKLDPASSAKRDESVAKEFQASRDATRLDHVLDGLQEMAKDANPAAAEAAHEARETTQKAELPKAMEDLAKGVEQLGLPEKAADKTVPKVTPQEAAKKGEELAQVLGKVDKNLDAFVAEAMNSQLDRLKAMETAAREAAAKAQDLAKSENKDAAQKPGENKEGKETAPKPGENKEAKEAAQRPSENKDMKEAGQKPGGDKEAKEAAQKPDQNKEQQTETAAQLAKDLQRLEPKLQRLEPNAPELVKMRQARAELDNARAEAQKQKTTPEGRPSPGPLNAGGPNFRRVSQQLDEVAGGLLNRIERLLRAREVKPDEDEDAPKEYRALVDRYYRALSEDVEEDEKQK